MNNRLNLDVIINSKQNILHDSESHVNIVNTNDGLKIFKKIIKLNHLPDAPHEQNCCSDKIETETEALEEGEESSDDDYSGKYNFLFMTTNNL